MDDEVAAKVKELKEKQEHKKSIRVKNIRQHTHHKNVEIDHRHRSSDREFDVRLYSQMDRNVWTYPDMREWFNKNALPENPLEYKLRPVDTGYTIAVDPTYREPTSFQLNEIAYQVKHDKFVENYKV